MRFQDLKKNLSKQSFFALTDFINRISQKGISVSNVEVYSELIYLSCIIEFILRRVTELK